MEKEFVTRRIVDMQREDSALVTTDVATHEDAMHLAIEIFVKCTSVFVVNNI